MIATVYSRAWLRCLRADLPDSLTSPEEVAKCELASFLGKGCFEIKADGSSSEEYSIKESNGFYTISGGKAGVLYGAYTLIFALETGAALPNGSVKPYYPLRMLNSWDNMDGSVERGYAGRSLWFDNGEFCYSEKRIRFLGRMLASAGINVLVINTVNVHYPAQELIRDKLSGLARFAALLRPFNVRLMVSVDFAMPLAAGLTTADPLDKEVIDWWRERARCVWSAVPDLAGFMVKADSEHRPGPNEYNRTHAEGANMLARAIAPYGGKLVWRAFVYNCLQDWRDTATDRANAAYDLYMPLDGAFDENVILQIKHGPFDFQVREPLSPLLLGLKHTYKALEVQLAQEYTGQQIDIYAMPPMWQEIFAQMDAESVSAVSAVSNLGNSEFWTGHPFALLNLYAFGRFAVNPYAEPRAVISEWAFLSCGMDDESTAKLTDLLLASRSVYEKYASQLGLGWMVTPNSHYGVNPWGYEFQSWGTYNRADRNAVGVDRTDSGTGYTSQYPDELRRLYENKASCPDKLLLFFHRLPYDYMMRDGRTLIQRIYDDHFEGCEAAEAMKPVLSSLPLPEPVKEAALRFIEEQIKNAREWRDVINTFFHRLSGIPDARGRRIYD